MENKVYSEDAHKQLVIRAQETWLAKTYDDHWLCIYYLQCSGYTSVLNALEIRAIRETPFPRNDKTHPHHDKILKARLRATTTLFYVLDCQEGLDAIQREFDTVLGCSSVPTHVRVFAFCLYAKMKALEANQRNDRHVLQDVQDMLKNAVDMTESTMTQMTLGWREALDIGIRCFSLSCKSFAQEEQMRLAKIMYEKNNYTGVKVVIDHMLFYRWIDDKPKNLGHVYALLQMLEGKKETKTFYHLRKGILEWERGDDKLAAEHGRLASKNKRDLDGTLWEAVAMLLQDSAYDDPVTIRDMYVTWEKKYKIGNSVDDWDQTYLKLCNTNMDGGLFGDGDMLRHLLACLKVPCLLRMLEQDEYDGPTSGTIVESVRGISTSRHSVWSRRIKSCLIQTLKHLRPMNKTTQRYLQEHQRLLETQWIDVRVHNAFLVKPDILPPLPPPEKLALASKKKNKKRAQKSSCEDPNPPDVVEQDDCAICLEALRESVKMGCGHLFHAGCQDDWTSRCTFLGLSRHCPICRALWS